MDNNFRFKNDVCPICGKPFLDNDEIVVCPLCGTPHHRDCYKKNGECANNDKHNEGYCWQSATAVPPINNTNNDNNGGNTPPNFENPYNSSNAPSTAFPNAQYSNGGNGQNGAYGNQFNPFNLFPKEVDDGVLTEEAAEFIGVGNFRYIQKFFYIKGKKKTFNWAAFFFAPYWFFYRKLHKLGAIFMAVLLALSIGVSLAGPTKALYEDVNNFTNQYGEIMNAEVASSSAAQKMSEEMRKIVSDNKVGAVLLISESLLGLAIRLLAGFMGDKWYFDFTVKKIKKIKNETEDINQRKLRLFKEGGVGFAVTIGAVLISETITMALSMLL